MPDLAAFLRHSRAAGRWLLLTVALAGSLAAACANRADIFAAGGKIFFVDADCYSRMTRVRAVCEHPGRVLAVHDFENYPFDTHPHTTVLLDYLIWALRGVLNLTHGGETLDLAGAWVSPLLGLVAVAGVGIWANLKRLPGRWPMLGVLAASPILAHGFSLGRPDHQSLVLACLAWAFAAEWAQWQAPSRAWGVVSGVAWALGLWTSLYEPLIFLGLVVLAAGLFNRRALRQRERLPGLAVAGAILLVALLVEGWRVTDLPGEGAGAAYFAAWSRQIGELASVPPYDPAFFGWTGWGLLAAPVLLLLPRFGEPDDDVADAGRRLARAHFLLLVAVWALTCWQQRWNYFLPLVYAMGLPWQLGALPARWRPVAVTLIVLGLWPMAAEWLGRLHPSPEQAAATLQQRQEAADLREVAEFIGRESANPPPDAGPTPSAGILAPWWQSPALAYWSGQPAVAGSSHESLPGIVDTARFYLETDARAAADLLRERRVRWIVVYRTDRMLDDTAAPLLGRDTVPPRCLGLILYKYPRLAPTYLSRPSGNGSYKVYEVRSALLP